MASETILKQKEEEVKALAEKFKDAKLVLLTDYRGISVADDTALRTEVRKANAEYKIIKNNIVKRALNAKLSHMTRTGRSGKRRRNHDYQVRDC